MGSTRELRKIEFANRSSNGAIIIKNTKYTGCEPKKIYLIIIEDI